jgi:hypothetical protein
MLNRSWVRQTLWAIGTGLMLLPYAFLIVISVVFSIQQQQLLFDYLLPLEVGFLIFGGILLIGLLCLRDHQQMVILVVLLIILAISFLAVMIIPQLAGFADSTEEPEGFWFIVSIIFVGLFDLAGLASGLYSLIGIHPKTVK